MTHSDITLGAFLLLIISNLLGMMGFISKKTHIIFTTFLFIIYSLILFIFYFNI